MSTALATTARSITVAASIFLTLSGCSINVGSHEPPKVSKETLQQDISQRLTSAGQTAQSVTCADDLVGQLGQIVRCDATMGPANSFEPVVTVTGLEGSKVDYDVTPSVAKTQLEAAVSQMVANSAKKQPDSVSCQSGLDGKVGAVAYCNVVTNGVPSRRTAVVSEVTGLSMKYGLIPVLAQPVLAASLQFQLNQIGKHTDTATCASDLEGAVGNTVECTTVTAGVPQTYVLTVTAVQGQSITFKYAEKA
jgi:uncharacterized protein DUF4333